MRRKARLITLHVWWALPKHNLGPDLPGHFNYTEAQEEARRLIAELMAGWQSKFPDVPLELRAVQSMNPSYTLIEASAQAGLVVVGSRGRGGTAASRGLPRVASPVIPCAVRRVECGHPPPDVFGTVYALRPGLFDQSGAQQRLGGLSVIDKVLVRDDAVWASWDAGLARCPPRWSSSARTCAD